MTLMHSCDHNNATHTLRCVIIALIPLLLSTSVFASSNTSSVSQYGITWEFDHEYETGQFITGDYWVVGPVTITSITRPSGQSDRDGSMINPMPGKSHGYDSRISDDYDPELNVANDLPLSIEPGSSLVSTISRPEGSGRPFPEIGAVLTILDEAPSETAFRPPYSGSRKPIYTWEDVNLDILPNLPPVASATRDRIESAKEAHSRPWISHVTGWQGAQHAPPLENMPNYGRDIAARGNDTAMMLMLDIPREDKEEIAQGFIQTGIDLHENTMNGARWGNIGGGLGVGFKLPGLLAGALLQNDEMRNFSQRNNPRYRFQEDAQIELLTEELREATYDTKRNSNSDYYYPGYFDDVPLGTPVWMDRGYGWREKTWYGVPSKLSYMVCCTTNATSGAALVVRLMDLEDQWNYDPFLEWVDLYQGYPTDEFYDKERRSEDWHFHWSRPFAREMWETYRPAADSGESPRPSPPEINGN